MSRKIEEMGQRIRQLEDDMATLQASVSSEPHSLLRDEYERSEDIDVMPELADALGTLKISEDGHARYFGSSGETEVRAHFFNTYEV